MNHEPTPAPRRPSAGALTTTPQSKQRTLRSVARPLTRSRIGRRVRGWVKGPNQGIKIPFGSVAPTTKGDDPIPTNSESVTTRFILLGEGRSGTSLLREELNRRWTEIHARGEIFSPEIRDLSASFQEIAGEAFADDAGATIVGFKLFSTQATEQQISTMLQLDGMRVIILRRRNPLRRYVSDQIARQTGRWREHRSSTPLEAIPIAARRITIDLQDLETSLQISEDRFREFDRLTFGVPKVGIWYEDLTADLNGELRRIATFLGAGEPAHEPPPSLVRQNPESLRDLIVNYDEVSRFLRRSGRSQYLLDGDSKEVGSEQPNNAEQQRPRNSSQP